MSDYTTTTGEKTCPHCNETKNVLAFAMDRKRADGLCVWCRDCTNEAAKETRRRKKRRGEVKKGIPALAPWHLSSSS